MPARPGTVPVSIEVMQCRLMKGLGQVVEIQICARVLWFTTAPVRAGEGAPGAQDAVDVSGAPYGNRTRVSAVKDWETGPWRISAHVNKH